MGGNRPAQMIAPLKRSWSASRSARPATVELSVSASLGDDAWRERFSPTSLECRRGDITLPVALAASPRVERSSIWAGILPADRRFEPLPLQPRGLAQSGAVRRSSLLVGSVDRHRIAALAQSRKRSARGMRKPVRRRDQLFERCAIIALKQFDDLRQLRAASGRGQAWGGCRNVGSGLNDLRAGGSDLHVLVCVFPRFV